MADFVAKMAAFRKTETKTLHLCFTDFDFLVKRLTGQRRDEVPLFFPARPALESRPCWLCCPFCSDALLLCEQRTMSPSLFSAMSVWNVSSVALSL